MSQRSRGLRLPAELEAEIEREAEGSGRSFSAVTQELLAEAVTMRRAPGIVFVDGPGGRRAAVAGSGLDVWEIIAAWKQCGGSEKKLAKEFDWLSGPQLRAALAYYRLRRDEVDARLAREAGWTPERLESELPAIAGSRRG